MISRAEVLAALKSVRDPISGESIVDEGLVRGLVITPGRIGFMIEVAESLVNSYGPVRLAAEKCLMALDGVIKAQVVLTAETPTQPQKPAQAKLSEKTIDQIKARAPVAVSRPDHVKRVIVVGSGKGGVGKSTPSLALALGFVANGLKVGYLDADIYGPSAPLMFGLTKAPQFDDKLMTPPQAFGLKVNSVGFLVDPDQAMIWRGPMASQALTQLLTQTRWGSEADSLDILVIDMPPGTGDIQLTLGQRTLIDGAVVVSTPQEMALIDARRSVVLFEKTSIKVLGMIENMAYFVAPDASQIEIFGRGGVKAMSEGLGVDFLGEVPLDPELRKGCDEGRPLTFAKPDGEMAQLFKHMARNLIQSLDSKD